MEKCKYTVRNKRIPISQKAKNKSTYRCIINVLSGQKLNVCDVRTHSFYCVTHFVAVQWHIDLIAFRAKHDLVFKS